MVILVATVGFDEKFIIRSIMRHSDHLEKIILVVAEPIDTRVEKALLSVQQFVNTVVKSVERNIELMIYRIDPRDFYRSISLIREQCFKEVGTKYVVNLSGGMRVLILATLAAAISSNIDLIIEVELENFLSVINIDPRVYRFAILDDYKKRIIRSLYKLGEATYKDLMKDTQIPRATLFRNLKELRQMGLITVTRFGRDSLYRLTDLGKAFL